MANNPARPAAPSGHPPSRSLTPDMLDSLLDLWGETGRMQWLAVSGRSMLPLIRDGDQVLVEFRPRVLGPGDVIVFRRDEQLVAHRVIRLMGEGDQSFIAAKGDNVAAFDPPCPFQDVVGRVHASRSRGCERQLGTRIWRTVGQAVAWLTSLLAWAYSGRQTSFANRGVRKLAQESIRWLVRAAMLVD